MHLPTILSTISNDKKLRQRAIISSGVFIFTLFTIIAFRGRQRLPGLNELEKAAVYETMKVSEYVTNDGKEIMAHPLKQHRRRAFVSFIQDTLEYVPAAITLGYSIRNNSGYYHGIRVKPKSNMDYFHQLVHHLKRQQDEQGRTITLAPIRQEHEPHMIMMVFSGLLEEKVVDTNGDVGIRQGHDNENKIKMSPAEIRFALEAAGWELRVVDPIKPFKEEGSFSRNVNDYTKLRVWNMTEFDSVVYLEPETVVKSSLVGLFDMVEPRLHYDVVTNAFWYEKQEWSIVATPNVWPDEFSYRFSTALMVLRPNEEVFERMMDENNGTLDYSSVDGEKGFLNAFFSPNKILLLPSTFNADVMMYHYHPALWNAQWDKTKIIYYSICKPFLTTCSQYEEPAKFWRWLSDSFVQTVIQKLEVE